MTHDFRQDYKALELDERADWNAARAAYRRLVHLWHPDRYAQRPRERVHAQHRFIQLTRAFDSLRNFHRTHRRLPLEPLHVARSAAGPDSRPAGTEGSPGRGAEAGGSGVRTRSGRPSEEAMLEAGMLGLRAPAPKRGRSRVKGLLWPATGLALVVGMLGVFVVLDRNARNATLEEGRDVLRRTAPSEFMPSASEVQKRSSRGTFIEREDSGRMGDQLMEDVFR